MARKRRKTGRKSNKWKWIGYIAMGLSTTGGTGGYLFRDHPMLAGLVRAVLGAENRPVGEALASGLREVVSLRVAGRFTVRVTEVELGPEVARGGRGPTVQVVVTKVDAAGRDGIVWESAPKVAEEDDRGGWVASWADDPFRVAWAPGERFVVEVIESQGLFHSSTFAMTHAGSSASFGLGSGERTVVRPADDRPESVGRIVFRTDRADDLGAAATAQVFDRVPIRR